MEEGGLPHEELVNSIRTESRQLQEIVRENRILRAMVAEHQTALEMIMSKYRSQVSHLITQTKADRLMNDLTAKVMVLVIIIIYIDFFNIFTFSSCRRSRRKTR